MLMRVHCSYNELWMRTSLLSGTTLIAITSRATESYRRRQSRLLIRLLIMTRSTLKPKPSMGSNAGPALGIPIRVDFCWLSRRSGSLAFVL